MVLAVLHQPFDLAGTEGRVGGSIGIAIYPQDATQAADLVRLADGAMYAAKRFRDMPILGDALEEAGCADEALLAHCRGPGPHVRGCWAVDLILGKG